MIDRLPHIVEPCIDQARGVEVSATVDLAPQRTQPVRDPRSVRAPRTVEGVPTCQCINTEGTQRLQEEVTPRIDRHHARVDQFGHRIGHVFAVQHSRRRGQELRIVEAEPGGEDAEDVEQTTRRVAQQSIGPVDESVQAPVPGRDPARTAQDPETPVQSVDEHCRGYRPRLRRRELDTERQAVEPSADLRDRRRSCFVQLEARIACPGTDTEQPDGIRRLDGGGRRVHVRHRKWIEGDDLFGGNSQRHP